MVKLFFGNRSFALLLLPVIIAGYYACNYFTGYHTPDTPASFGFWGTFSLQTHWSFQLSAMLLVFINGILINTLFNRNEFMEKNNFIVSMVYVTCMSYFHCFYYLDGLTITLTLLILTLNQLFKLRQNQDGRRSCFNAAFIFGVACTFYPILLLGTPFLFGMVWIIRPFILRESVLITLGFTVPLIYAGVYSKLFNVPLEREQFTSSTLQVNAIDMMVLVGGIILLLMMCFKTLVNKLRTSSIRLKKLFRIILLLFVFLLSIVLLEYFVFHKTDVLAILLLPVAFYLPYAFGTKEQRAVPTITYYLLLLFSVSKFFISFDALAF